MTRRKPLLVFLIIILCEIALGSTGHAGTIRLAICQIQVIDGLGGRDGYTQGTVADVKADLRKCYRIKEATIVAKAGQYNL